MERLLKDRSRASSLWVRNLQLALFSLPVAAALVPLADAEALRTQGALVGLNGWAAAVVVLTLPLTPTPTPTLTLTPTPTLTLTLTLTRRLLARLALVLVAAARRQLVRPQPATLRAGACNPACHGGLQPHMCRSLQPCVPAGCVATSRARGCDSTCQRLLV